MAMVDTSARRSTSSAVSPLRSPATTGTSSTTSFKPLSVSRPFRKTRHPCSRWMPQRRPTHKPDARWSNWPITPVALPRHPSTQTPASTSAFRPRRHTGLTEHFFVGGALEANNTNNYNVVQPTVLSAVHLQGAVPHGRLPHGPLPNRRLPSPARAIDRVDPRVTSACRPWQRRSQKGIAFS